jgi:hypothetical protein
MNNKMKMALVSGLLALAALPAAAQVTTTIQGQLAPGVYGRVDIGNAPPPVIYAQPIIIQRGPNYVQRQPVYLRVPPGHEKNWGKHCRKYNACGQPVYFVTEQGGYGYRGDSDDRGGKGKDKHYKEKNKDKHHGKGRGKGDHDD